MGKSKKKAFMVVLKIKNYHPAMESLYKGIEKEVSRVFYGYSKKNAMRVAEERYKDYQAVKAWRHFFKDEVMG